MNPMGAEGEVKKAPNANSEITSGVFIMSTARGCFVFVLPWENDLRAYA